MWAQKSWRDVFYLFLWQDLKNVKIDKSMQILVQPPTVFVHSNLFFPDISWHSILPMATGEIFLAKIKISSKYRPIIYSLDLYYVYFFLSSPYKKLIYIYETFWVWLCNFGYVKVRLKLVTISCCLYCVQKGPLHSGGCFEKNVLSF